MNIAYNMDCLEAMKEMKDNEFNLAIVDPPYGLGKRTTSGGGGKNTQSKKWNNHDWDNEIPNKEYFDELSRVSKNQIIWGANYFKLHSYRAFIVWEKMTFIPSMSQVELAYTTFDSPGRLIKINSNQTNRIHPTQKPVLLYKWLLTNYAKQGDKILDTHLGSGSSRIACYDLGFDFVGYELDKDYFEAQEKRFQNHINQEALFTPEQINF